MAYYNLPPTMVQHWSYVYELNGYLMDVVRFLTRGHRDATQPLNPLAPEYVYQKKRSDTGKEDYKNQENEISKWIQKGRMFHRHHSNPIDNIKVNDNKNPHKVRKRSPTNRFQVLEEDEMDDVENDNTVVKIIAQDIRIEELTKEYNNAKEKMNTIKECYDVEAMTVQALQKLLGEYVEHQAQESQKKEDEHMEEKVYSECLQIITCSELENAIKCYDTSCGLVETMQHKLINAEVQYDKIMLRHKNLDHQYKRFMLEYEEEKERFDEEREQFYHDSEWRNAENRKRREDERRKSKYKSKGCYW